MGTKTQDRYIKAPYTKRKVVHLVGQRGVAMCGAWTQMFGSTVTDHIPAGHRVCKNCLKIRDAS